MEHLKLFLLLLQVCNAWASKCAVIAHRLNCTCDPEQHPDGSDFTATCVDENVNLKYDNSRSYFQVKCQSALSISETLFSDFLVLNQNVENIKFEGCTLPETLFPKSLYDLSFKKLVILCKGRTGPDSNWSTVMLQKLNYMEELLIQGCPTATVPEELLQANPSLNKLYLEDNQIQTLPEKLLYNITQLKILTLVNNAIKDIPDNFFKLSAALEDLNVKKNSLDKISLAGLKTLKNLDLSLNNFSNIPEDMFLDNSLLVNLNLGWNKIVNVTTRPFKSLGNLKMLIMSKNGPDIRLPSGFLEGLVKLRNLSLSDCHMTKPPPDLLSWSRNLEHLELGNNRIEAFPNTFFQYQIKLKMLDLAFNDLKEDISENTFQGLKNLNNLSLRRNNFTTFPDNILQPLNKLTVLHLEENFLEELNMIGNSVLFLKELNVKQNRICRWVTPGLPFGQRTGIEIVDLSGNNLTDLNINMAPYNVLKLLDLSNNHFPVAILPLFYSSNNLIVNLAGCSIQTVNCSLIDLSPDTMHTQYVLQENQLVCDCRQLEFQTILKNKPAMFLKSTDLKCRTITNKAYVKILDVDAQDFICEDMPCPNSCFCFQKAQNVIVVDCQGKGLTDLSQLTAMPNAVSVLKLQQNNLTTIRDISQEKWENVTEFYVDKNQIISEDWTLPKTLKILSLSNNNLKWFPNCLVSFVQGENTRLNLGYNPWDCNCSAWDFHNAVWGSLDRLDSQFITCATPEKFKGLSVTSWKGNKLCPPKNNVVLSVVLPILVCSLIAVILILLVTIYFKNRQTFIAYLFTHWHKIFTIFFAEKDLDEDRHFHAFVAYSSDDRHIVESLLGQLENKPPHYKLCIHERDWLPGNPIIWNIVNSVQNSRRTILIVSKQFIKSMWFQLEYSIAYHQMLEDKVDRLIVIVNGERPDPSEMDEELTFLMSTKTYLIWEERWFWEKLRYALPHQNANPATVPRPAKERPNNSLIHKIEDKILSIASETMQGPAIEGKPNHLHFKIQTQLGKQTSEV